MLCLCLVCNVISSSGLKCYTYVWIAMLYLCLDWKFIPMSGFLYYTYFWFFQIWFKAFIPTSDLQYYTYICYGYFCFFLIWFQTCYSYVWFAFLYLRLLYPIPVYSILLVMASSVISSSAPPLELQQPANAYLHCQTTWKPCGSPQHLLFPLPQSFVWMGQSTSGRAAMVPGIDSFAVRACPLCGRRSK